MRKLIFIATLIPFASSAQQDLKDDSYIYHNKQIRYAGRTNGDIQEIVNNTAVIYNDSLHKKVDMRAFLKNYGAYYGRLHSI